MHYWIGDSDWTKVSIEVNVEWLCSVSDELEDALRVIVECHVQEDSPLIIDNYLDREGGEIQGPMVPELLIISSL